MFYFFLLLCSFFASFGLAAPHPATSSSNLNSPENGYYFLHQGFSLKTNGSSWLPNSESTNALLDTIRFSDKSNPQGGFLTVRTDKVVKSASLELYARKWLREYPNYGFEILTNKQFSLNGQPALIVDMMSRSKGKQIRQVVLKNEEKIAVMTCMDDKESFSKSVRECNQIIKSFKWTSLISTPNKK